MESTSQLIASFTELTVSSTGQVDAAPQTTATVTSVTAAVQPVELSPVLSSPQPATTANTPAPLDSLASLSSLKFDSFVLYDIETTIPATDMIEFGAIVLDRCGCVDFAASIELTCLTLLLFISRLYPLYLYFYHCLGSLTCMHQFVRD